MNFSAEYRDFLAWKSAWMDSPEEYERQQHLNELLDSAIESVNKNKVTDELKLAVDALV